METSRKKIYDIACVAVGILLLSRALVTIGVVDNDYYFLSATGDVIRETGSVPCTNPFFVFEDRPFVVQQWLWCILCSFLKDYGNIGVSAVQTIQLIVTEFLLFGLLKIKKNSLEDTEANKYIKEMRFPQIFLTANLGVMLSFGFVTSIRPEGITIILLLLQIYATEKYLESGKMPWLFILPFTTLAEINMHSSLWFMHYCVLVPYFLPFYKSKARSSVKPFIVPMILMTASLFVNPVGIKAIMFTFDAVTMGTFKIFKNSEMRPFITGGYIYIAAVFFIIDKFVCSIKRKTLSAEELYISSGLLILIITTLKSAMYMPLMAFYFFPHLFVSLTPHIKKDAIKETLAKKAPAILTCTAAAAFGLSGYKIVSDLKNSSFSANINDTSVLSFEVSKCAEGLQYIKEHSDKSTRIMTDYNLGGYLEMQGFRSCYMDARPESYAFPNTSVLGDCSVLAESEKLGLDCANTEVGTLMQYIGIHYDFTGLNDEEKRNSVNKAIQKGLTYSDEEVDKILEIYDFDYIITSDYSRLAYYLNQTGTYKTVFSYGDESTNYQIMQKI